MTYLTLHNLLNSSKLPSEVSMLSENSSAVHSTSNVTNLLQFTIPDGKLYYPEPFIASPSYLHSDLTYLHIFQYWYWLWFLFIFLICFFFISFVCTVRWCTTRVRPRRETRGVSRSKCGDLITACVPVSWAISIIVNESADATDLNDGFGSAELVVGVRAYQWGWEYYYPRSIDLNYNVRPSYSTFVGNSLQYNFASGKSLNTNNLWRMYQNKVEDQVVTPAHLLLIPVDSGASTNFINFKNIGLDTLQGSSAFAKIRNATKIYTSHLVHTPSNLSTTYQKLNSVFSNENDFLTTSSFGLKRQHNLTSISALGNNFATTTLDLNSFDKFLSSNLLINNQSSNEQLMLPISDSPLSASKNVVSSSLSQDSSRITSITGINDLGSSSFTKFSAYPSLLNYVNDNSDKAGLNYPSTRLASTNLVSGSLQNPSHTFNVLSSGESVSGTATYSDLTRSNLSTSPKNYNLSGPNSKVLLADQSIRAFPDITPSKSNYNLSFSPNTTSSNLGMSTALNRAESPFSTSLDSRLNYADYRQFNLLLSSRSFISESHSPILSSDPNLNNTLDYDTTSSSTRAIAYSPKGILEDVKSTTKNAVGEVFVGSREKTPRSINTAYWSTFWSLTNPVHRVSSVLSSNFNQSKFYLPLFYTYVDYDFRNDQAIDMLEELFWETNFSGYGFYDYMTISKDISNDQLTSPKDISLDKQFFTNNIDLDVAKAPLTEKLPKELTSTGVFYGNSIQMEDSMANPKLVNSANFALFPLHTELSELDDSFASFKGLNSLFSKFSSIPMGTLSLGNAPRSYISVFNHFRSDYEDFSWSRLTSSSNTVESAVSDWDDGSVFGSDLRLSNAATLRPSIRNAIVNHNAFQKVFRPRLDEGRAHSQSSSFADLGLRQPFLSDSKIPYLQLLGKNRDSFYETPLYFLRPHKNTNMGAALHESLNTPMYDFPFLLSRTSDLIRFTWIDWFSKWKHIEVQPSSVSRYSTIGVPYMRKPYDFNSATGDKVQDTESYFTRVARSRRNYLTNWSYSPFMYNRSYLWNAESSLNFSFLQPTSSLSSTKYTLDLMGWYWQSPAQLSAFSDKLTYSSSGNSEYSKSTWRPRVSISAYYYNVSKLIDILSRREFLYRQFLEQSAQVVHLPVSLCATPSNPLLEELKASFLFSDPANFSSEYSRDVLYASQSYFKFTFLRNCIQTVADASESLPINHALLTNYILFYFFGSNSPNSNMNLELYKSQFRPLKKGISSMLRLHATGAIAMPIEMRLQVLASSRDVIHSWAIPSASVKIDCVPGYTSHRMMKFLLTGVYWGQCQEICGRYHHWMPIVVYFMKRDLFFLWCTHFVFGPAPNETWDISDRRFADLIRFASYDRSSWLNEFGSQLA